MQEKSKLAPSSDLKIEIGTIFIEPISHDVRDILGEISEIKCVKC